LWPVEAIILSSSPVQNLASRQDLEDKIIASGLGLEVPKITFERLAI